MDKQTHTHNLVKQAHTWSEADLIRFCRGEMPQISQVVLLNFSFVNTQLLVS